MAAIFLFKMAANPTDSRLYKPISVRMFKSYRLDGYTQVLKVGESIGTTIWEI